jgi:hypothetical protein
MVLDKCLDPGCLVPGYPGETTPNTPYAGKDFGRQTIEN